MRIETGALQIDNDWTGLFIRGDDALHLREMLSLVYHLTDAAYKPLVRNLIWIIDRDVNHSSAVRNVQVIFRQDAERPKIADDVSIEQLKEIRNALQDRLDDLNKDI